MAQPKKKTSKSRTKRRYSAWARDAKKKILNRVLPVVGQKTTKPKKIKKVEAEAKEVDTEVATKTAPEKKAAPIKKAEKKTKVEKKPSKKKKSDK